jgi:hypothetical protein
MIIITTCKLVISLFKENVIVSIACGVSFRVRGIERGELTDAQPQFGPRGLAPPPTG